MIAGVDYGSKTAGTTVLARVINGEIVLSQSLKGQNADSFISEIVAGEDIRLIALDAPLSLPGKLVSVPGKDNYFYRDCDSQLKAMSPMFIGGLTARAIKLKDEFIEQGREVIEAYPKAFVVNLTYDEFYSKKNLSNLQEFIDKLNEEFSDFRFPEVKNWHQTDAIIALLIAHKYQKGTHSSAGDPDEGLIIY